MIFRRTKALVLKSTDYSNTSNIVTVFTRDHGKVRLLAKGSRRKKSDFSHILQPLSLLEIVYILSRRTLHTLKEAHLIDPHLDLRDHLSRITQGLFFLSLIDRTQPDEDPDPAVFDLLATSLCALRSVSRPQNVAIVFQLHLLRHFGRSPSLSACGRCSTPLSAGVVYDPSSAVFLCNSCAQHRKWPLSGGTLQALRRLAETPPHHSDRIKLSKEQLAEVAPVLNAMFRAAAETDLPATNVVKALLE